jgi:hypothetical protein
VLLPLSLIGAVLAFVAGLRQHKRRRAQGMTFMDAYRARRKQLELTRDES